MGPAHDDGHSPLSERVRDLVGPKRVDRPGRQGNEVGGGVEIEPGELLVDQRDLPSGRGQGREVGEGKTDQPPLSYPARRPLRLRQVMGRLNNGQFHPFMVRAVETFVNKRRPASPGWGGPAAGGPEEASDERIAKIIVLTGTTRGDRMNSSQFQFTGTRENRCRMQEPP